MNNERPYTERELEKLEAKLRRFGTPYVTPEPDERYFANFRVRVMEKIDAKEVASKRSVFATIVEWFSVSVFRGVGVGVATLGITFAAFMLTRSPEIPSIAETMPPVITDITKIDSSYGIHETHGSDGTILKPTVVKKETPAPNLAEQPVKPNSEQIADEASDFAHFDETLSVGTADDPIDYSSLSEAELESLVDVASTMN